MVGSLKFGTERVGRRFTLQSVGIILLISLLNGCAFQELMSPQSQFQNSETKPLPYYVGVDGLRLYQTPDVNSDVIARLRLHQKVMRSKLNKGYGFVTVVESGKQGWVDNAKLIWKLPAKTDGIPPKRVLDEPNIAEPPKPIQNEEVRKPQDSDVEPPSQSDTISPSIFDPF